MAPKHLPSYDELPSFNGKPGCAWEVWGKDDQLGTIGLLTPDVVRQAAKEEIQTGRSVSLSWPINFPKEALFHRESAHIEIKGSPDLPKGDDVIHMNSQAGSQWDGLRHYGLLDDHVFYNNTPRSAIPTGKITIDDPAHIDQSYVKLGIHNWAEHGISGRGVLLDLVEFYTGDGSALPYDPWDSHGFTVQDLEACAKKEGVQFRTGDILIIRAGWIRKYYKVTDEKRQEAARAEGDPPFRFAGIEQSENMKRFLWNNHFAAAASDQPTLEHWPPIEGILSNHQTMLGLWGMPIGELFDLESLSQICKETGRYTFFFTSWPLRILGGCASPPNAAAFF